MQIVDRDCYQIDCDIIFCLNVQIGKKTKYVLATNQWNNTGSSLQQKSKKTPSN